MLRPRIAASLAVAVLALTACESGTTTESSGSTSRPSTSASSGPSSSSTSGGSATSSTTTATAPVVSECVRTVADAMTPEQQAGQLLMVALTPEMGQGGLDAQLADGLGGMVYLGGWTGRPTVAAASAHLQRQAPRVDGNRVGVLVAADQEGGEVQQLTGEGFSTIPSGREQGAMDPADLTADATTWGSELKAAGVNVNLAPTTDTVPADVGRANGPIGAFGREYGSTPSAAGQGASAFAKGMTAAGVRPTAKHFPGIGRITGNTDATATGIDDPTATTKDPHLAAFRSVLRSAPSLVMVSNARYPKIDAKNQAPFSRAIITGMLREDLGFDGVVVTDDVGAAKAVADVPVGQRATRFIAAGGDIVLTADASQTATMTSAIVRRAGSDEGFADQVEASVVRVLTLKEDMGLLRCGS